MTRELRPSKSWLHRRCHSNWCTLAMIKLTTNSALPDRDGQRAGAGKRERSKWRGEGEREISPVKPMNARRAPITELLLRAVYTGASAAASSAANCFNRPYLTTRLNKSRIYVTTYGGHGTMMVLTKQPAITLDNYANKDRRETVKTRRIQRTNTERDQFRMKLPGV